MTAAGCAMRYARELVVQLWRGAAANAARGSSACSWSLTLANCLSIALLTAPPSDRKGCSAGSVELRCKQLTQKCDSEASHCDCAISCAKERTDGAVVHSPLLNARATTPRHRRVQQPRAPRELTASNASSDESASTRTHRTPGAPNSLLREEKCPPWRARRRSSGSATSWRARQRVVGRAAGRGAPVLPVFCLDPRVFDASARATSAPRRRRDQEGKVRAREPRGPARFLGISDGLVVRRGSP